MRTSTKKLPTEKRKEFRTSQGVFQIYYSDRGGETIE